MLTMPTPAQRYSPMLALCGLPGPGRLLPLAVPHTAPVPAPKSFPSAKGGGAMV